MINIIFTSSHKDQETPMIKFHFVIVSNCVEANIILFLVAFGYLRLILTI